MTAHAHIDLKYIVANDDTPLADIVPGHILARRMQRHLMVGVAVLSCVMLTATVLTGFNVMKPEVDLVTFAARV